MSQKLPDISVCIPAYNCERYIDQAIESVLGQTFDDFELVIVDDCSSDKTATVVEKYDDPRIRFFENKSNLGMQGNWNKAVSKARGKNIKVLCNDDLLYSSCLERQHAIFSDPANDDVVMVSCQRDIISGTGKKVLSRKFSGVKGKLHGAEAVKKTIRSGTNLIGEPTAVLFRTDVFSKISGFDDSIPYLIDLDMWSRLLLHGDIFVIPESLCAFRVSTVSASVGMVASQNKDYKNFIKKVRKESAYGLTWLDEQKGRVWSFLNSIMRQVFYKFVIAKRNKDSDQVVQ